MPGIAGLISREPPQACGRLVEEMIASMQHDKFHITGTYCAPDVGVWAGWSALDHSFADCQPILNEAGDVALLLAGECFSDPHDRAQLKRRGHRFTDSDATWLVHLYEEKGDSFFEQLNGLFSGLLIDRRIRKAYLFNDRYGMERLYLHEGRNTLFFASEAKALLRILPETRALCDEAIAQFRAYGCTLNWKSLFRGVELLPGASVWSFDSGRWTKRHYFRPASWETQSPLSEVAFANELEETFSRILPRYFVPDGHIGISLTAGLDTRMIMACRPETRDGLLSYTFGGANRDTLDVRLAARVAAACDIPHHVLRIGQDFFSDFASHVDRTVYITDGYFGATGAHEIYLHGQARELAPIRLTGNFGSEILRGVTTFKPLHLSDRLFADSVLEVPSLRKSAHPVSFAVFTEIPWHIFGTVRAAQSQVTVRTPYMDNAIVALAYRAPMGLRKSSGPALQTIRKNNPKIGSIRTDFGLVPKSRLASLANYAWHHGSFRLDYWCGDGMPHWLSDLERRLARLRVWPWSPGRHKFLHYRDWFRADLSQYVTERIHDISARGSYLWNRPFLHELLIDHREGRKNYVREIDVVLTLDAVDRVLLKQAY